MARRLITITARIAFILCGLTSLFTGVPYVLLRGEDLPVESEWIIFVIALALVGAFSIVAACLPRSWVASLCKQEREDDRLFSVPLKWLASFAAVSYLIAVFAYSAPHTWNVNPQIMLALCPMYFVKMTIDPSLIWILLILAPMNAAVYGALGVMAGYASLRSRN